MKPLLHIEMLVIALLGVPCSALVVSSVGGEAHEDLKGPDLGSAFRSDTTLRFMRKLHQNQPGYGSKSDKKANQEDVIPDSLQQGPKHNSKKAQKTASKIGDDQAKTKGAAELDAPDSLQHGPQYDSKKSQKATDEAADKQKKMSGTREGGTAQSLNPFGHTISDAVKDAQKGPNYDKKAKKKQNKPEKPEGIEEPQEKEPARDSSSVPGCRNSPGDWTDSKNRDCEDYAEGEWCSRSGGYGDAWLDEWGTFEDAATKGKSAKQACCVCGGGEQQDEKADDLAREIASKKILTSASPAGAPVPAISGPILGGKSDRPLQEQGYSGELVAHEDQVTMTEDWGREFGPHAGHRDIKSICAEKPGNEWCSLHGYYDKERSCASMKSVVAVLATLLLSFFR